MAKIQRELAELYNEPLDKLFLLCRDRGISGEEIARYLDVSRQAVSLRYQVIDKRRAENG